MMKKNRFLAFSRVWLQSDTTKYCANATNITISKSSNEQKNCYWTKKQTRILQRPESICKASPNQIGSLDTISPT